MTRRRAGAGHERREGERKNGVRDRRENNMETEGRVPSSLPSFRPPSIHPLFSLFRLSRKIVLAQDWLEKFERQRVASWIIGSLDCTVRMAGAAFQAAMKAPETRRRRQTKTKAPLTQATVEAEDGPRRQTATKDTPTSDEQLVVPKRDWRMRKGGPWSWGFGTRVDRLISVWPDHTYPSLLVVFDPFAQVVDVLIDHHTRNTQDRHCCCVLP